MWRVVDGSDFWMFETKKEAKEYVHNTLSLFDEYPQVRQATYNEIDYYLKCQEAINLGRCILLYRTREGLSQRDLGLSLGVSQVTVSDWEHNKQVPSPKNLEKLESRLNFEWRG